VTTRRKPQCELVFEEEGTGQQPRADEPSSSSTRMRAQRSVHLLFVDDDPLAEMTLRRAFRRLGVDGPLTIAHDGLEALELLRDPFFPLDRCLILLDLNMPRPRRGVLGRRIELLRQAGELRRLRGAGRLDPRLLVARDAAAYLVHAHTEAFPLLR